MGAEAIIEKIRKNAAEEAASIRKQGEDRAAAAAKQITDAASEAGFDARWVDAGGASDGNHMAEAGIPVVDGCGPAGGGFHSEREFLRLETVEERINMIVNLLKRL